MAEVCRLEIKAVPNAPRSEIVGWMGTALKVRLHAPPVDGKANEELCRFLAEALGLPKGSVTLGRGASSRQKIVEITGLGPAELREKLPAG
jgi:uncharacterized protein